MPIASHEIVAKYEYTSGTKANKSLTGLKDSLTIQSAKAAIEGYSRAVDGELKSANFKSVEPIDID